MLRKYWIHGLWLLSIPMYLWGGTRPDRYAMDVLRTQPSYPVQGIIHSIVITTIESLILYAVIRPNTYRRSWKRAGAALLLFFPWLLVCALMLMHMPAYVLLHFLWVLSVNLILLGLCMYSFVRVLL